MFEEDRGHIAVVADSTGRFAQPIVHAAGRSLHALEAFLEAGPATSLRRHGRSIVVPALQAGGAWCH